MLFPAIWHLAMVTCLFNTLKASHLSAGSLAVRNWSQTSICLLGTGKKWHHGPAVIHAASECLMRVSEYC